MATITLQPFSNSLIVNALDTDLGPWTASSNSMPASIGGGTAVEYNGYVYVIGGMYSDIEAHNSVYYASLNADGSVGTWISSLSLLPSSVNFASSVIANGYIYVIGGFYHGGQSTDNVYYAPLNSDGSVGTWSISNRLPETRAEATTIVANNYIYEIGGYISDNGGHSTKNTYYAPLNSDGSVGTWNISQNLLPYAKEAVTSVLHNNHIYVIGGFSTDVINGFVPQSSVYYTEINPDGSIGAWVLGNSLPAPRFYSSLSVANGYVHVLGGGDNVQFLNTDLYAKLNSDGSIGSWINSENPLPAPLFAGMSVSANSYIYTFGGEGPTFTDAVYYAKAPQLASTPILVDGVTSPFPNAAGWNNSNVTINWSVTDQTNTANIPNPTIVLSDGANQVITSGQSCNAASNCATGNVTLNIDKMSPTAGTINWSANPIQVGTNSTVTVPVSDALSGVVDGEYYINTDPGVGNATPIAYTSGSLNATFGSSLTPGVYTVGIRAQDAAGNWSPTIMTMLVIYDSSTNLGITGKNKKDLIPSLSNGDIMPGLISGTQTDAVDYGFTAQYKKGILDSHNGFKFTYNTGTNCGKNDANNCHVFNLDATIFEWLTIGSVNNSQGWFQGVATVTVDGVTTTNPFTATGIDGGRLNPATDNYLQLKVFYPGADPTTASPLYQASGDMSSKNSVKIQ